MNVTNDFLEDWLGWTGLDWAGWLAGWLVGWLVKTSGYWAGIRYLNQRPQRSQPGQDREGKTVMAGQVRKAEQAEQAISWFQANSQRTITEG